MQKQASNFPVQVRSLQGVEAARAPPRKYRWYQRNGRGRWSASSEAQENVWTSFLVTPEQFLISGITTSGKEHNIRSEHQEWQVLVAQRYLLFPHLIFRAKKVFLANQTYCSLKFSNFWVAPSFSSALIAQIVDEQDKMQRTPLFLAAKYNHLEVVQILVQRCRKSYLNFEHFEALPLSGGQSWTSEIIRRSLLCWRQFLMATLTLQHSYSSNLRFYAMHCIDLSIILPRIAAMNIIH